MVSAAQTESFESVHHTAHCTCTAQMYPCHTGMHLLHPSVTACQVCSVLHHSIIYSSQRKLPVLNLTLPARFGVSQPHRHCTVQVP